MTLQFTQTSPKTGYFKNYYWEIGSWSGLEEGASTVRHLVFVKEQNVPEDLEYDEYDTDGVHILVMHAKSPIATARLIKKMDSNINSLGRMAVLPDYRGEGIARYIVEMLLRFSYNRGDVSIELHAQCHAVGFYEKMGFKSQGDVFLEAGIPHIQMVTDLQNNPQIHA